MLLKAYAKINLGLSVSNVNYLPLTEKHKITSLFLKSDNLFDEIEIHEANKDNISYLENQEEIFIEDCLIAQGLKYLEKKQLKAKHYLIQVKKKIPTCAGLGGSSSDLASIFLYIIQNENRKVKWDYREIALELGSDVPFFLSGYKNALVSEFGDEVKEIKLNDHYTWKIHKNLRKIKTKVIFKKLINNYTINEVENNNFAQLISDYNNAKPLKITNVFQELVFQDYPEVREYYLFLLKQHDFVIMTGSGSSMVSFDKKDRKIRTRYAPSPTGFFHIGGARTAIFNYLFSKHYNGEFIVRIEDTDVERNVEGGIESQLDNLSWMGIIPDESVNNPGAFGPYIQSAKLERYQELARNLVKEGKAYYCFCSEEQLEKDREEALKNHETPRYSKRCLHLSEQEQQELLKQNIPHVIRLKIDDNKEYSWDDLIRGKISVPGSAMTDPVILKSNNIAMYNFAVVVDDYDMQITHVLRGEEHISNTPYQIAIKNALGFDKQLIEYGHLSVIIDETGKKLSKRNKTLKQFMSDYREMGFIPQSIVNFLALLGWTPSNNLEILDLDSLIKEFDIINLSKSSTFFDFKKLLWIGNEYFKKMGEKEYLEFVKSWVLNKQPQVLNDHQIKHLDMLLLLFKDQISYADQLNELITEFLAEKELVLSDEMLEVLKSNVDVIQVFETKLSSLVEFNEQAIKTLVEEVKKETGKKGKNLFMPLRIASTWMMHGPELAKIIFLTDKEKVLSNIKKVLTNLQL